MDDVATRLEDRLRGVATPERAASEKRYLKSDLDFIGSTVWQIRGVVKDLLGELPSLDHDRLIELVTTLWDAPVHERRMAAVVFLERRADLLTSSDVPVIERLVRESRTWALVDALAGDVIGTLALREPVPVATAMDRWASDPDFWIRRSSLLAELRSIRSGAPLDRFRARADRMLDEREFFIRKAIGWVLREAAKKRPDEVAAWLAQRTYRASGVTMREAVKYLSAARSESLMNAYRQRRPAVAT